MKALILAAGLGSRLAPITNERPKCLVPVHGKPILLKQIENLNQYGITDITVVTGYQSDVVEAFLREHHSEVRVLPSREYASTNNMYSAYLGRECMGGTDFFMMNADVFFEASILGRLLNISAPNAIAVEIGQYIEESMKVAKSGDRIVGISKQIRREEALGTSIDVYKFSEEGGKAFFRKCSEYIEDRNELGLWSEVALNDILKDVLFQECPIQERWIEIDTHEDLKKAEILFKA